MPELPEVETIKRGLAKNITGKIIRDFDCNWLKMINFPLKTYRRKINRLKIQSVKRRAKMIILALNNEVNILIHLKMTGQLVYGSKTRCVIGGHPISEGYACLPNKFTHATFTFTDKSKLFFNDIRKFGWLRIFNNKELHNEFIKLKLGPEPLSQNFNVNYLKQTLKIKPNKKIKQFLMDPTIVVGIGNIYSDEICFYAKVRPTRLAKNLNSSEINLLYKGIRKILNDSIKAQGTTFSNYRNAQGEAGAYSKKLKVYGRYNQKCKQCDTIIKRIKLGGRSSSFCPKCQK